MPPNKPLQRTWQRCADDDRGKIAKSQASAAAVQGRATPLNADPLGGGVISQFDSQSAPRAIDARPLPGRVYSSGQVAGATFVGGPLAASILLGSNCALFRSRVSRSQAISLGVVASFVLMTVVIFVPENTPNSLIPAIYTAVVHQLAQRTQGASIERFIGSGGAKYSNWLVLGIGVVCMVVFMAVFLGIFMLLPDELVLGAPAT